MTTKLKLDYDGITDDDVALIFYHRGWLVRKLGLVSLEAASTTHGYHVEAVVNADLRPQDVILAQMLLGSDIHREIYNFLHHLDGEMISQWNKLFDKKTLVLKTGIKVLSQETPNPNLTARLVRQIEKKKATP